MEPSPIQLAFDLWYDEHVGRALERMAMPTRHSHLIDHRYLIEQGWHVPYLVAAYDNVSPPFDRVRDAPAPFDGGTTRLLLVSEYANLTWRYTRFVLSNILVAEAEYKPSPAGRACLLAFPYRLPELEPLEDTPELRDTLLTDVALAQLAR